MSATVITIKDAAAAYAADTVETRRDFHRHPEIAFEEVRTSGIVAERLRALGLEVRTGIGKTGVVALLDSGKPGKTVIARADMDALPVHCEKPSDYASTISGKMHACGHDGHTAVLLTVAQILTERKSSFSGKVLFVFQPAEEVVQGAQAMLEDGALENIKADHAIGLHLSSALPLGQVALRAGPSMAASDAFGFTVKGHGGHAAMPHTTVDPVLISAHVISGLQTLVSRETDPLDQAVISITSIHAGTAYNIIPEEVALKGTLRTFSAETRARLQERIVKLIEGTAELYGGSATLEWVHGSPAVVNDAEMTGRMWSVAQRVAGEANVQEMAPIMGGDDMALWLEQARGTYFFVGARNEATGMDKPHHHPQFDVDETSLPLAVELLAEGVLDFLNQA